MPFHRRNLHLNLNTKKELSGAKSIFEVFYSMSTATPPGAFPLWTGEWIHDCATLYPDFYQKALEYKASGNIRVVDNTSYDNEVSVYGQTGAFVIDEASGDIRLPKIISYIGGFNDVNNVGETLPAAIPNVKGTLGSVATPKNSGPFTYVYGNNYGNFNINNYNGTVTFDASKVSEVYKDGVNTVQPPSVRLALYIQVFNRVAMEGYVNVSEALNLINNYYKRMDQKIQDALNTINSIIEGGALGMPEYERSINLGENAFVGTYSYTTPSDGWFYVRWVNSNADPTRVTTVRIYKDASKSQLLATHTTSDGRRAGKDGGLTDQTIFIPVKRGYYLEAMYTNYRRFYPIFGQ